MTSFLWNPFASIFTWLIFSLHFNFLLKLGVKRGPTFLRNPPQESIPGTEIDSKSDIYDSDSSKKRTYNTSTCCPKVAISLDRSDCRFTYLSPYFTQRPFIMSLLTVAVGLLVWSKGYENLALHVARCEIHATFRDDWVGLQIEVQGLVFLASKVAFSWPSVDQISRNCVYF